MPDDWYERTAEIQRLEQWCYKHGLYCTAHAINRALRVAGWELAGDPNPNAKADRTYEKEFYA